MAYMASRVTAMKAAHPLGSPVILRGRLLWKPGVAPPSRTSESLVLLFSWIRYSCCRGPRHGRHTCCAHAWKPSQATWACLVEAWSVTSTQILTLALCIYSSPYFALSTSLHFDSTSTCHFNLQRDLLTSHATVLDRMLLQAAQATGSWTATPRRCTRARPSCRLGRLCLCMLSGTPPLRTDFPHAAHGPDHSITC